MSYDQLPPAAPIRVVAGNPLTITVACSGATVTAGQFDLLSAPGVISTVVTPTVTTNASTITVAFTAADTTAIQALTGASSKKSMTFSLSGMVNGVGPYELIAADRQLEVYPVGSTIAGTTTTSNLSVTVGGLTIALAVNVGGAANAAGLAFTPAAGIAATNVQAAIVELVADVASQYPALKPTVMTPGNLWIFGGDSITNGSGSSNFSYSFANHTAAAVGGLVMLQNSIEAGTAGDRSDNLLARLPAAITTYSAKGAVILIGTNDANQSVTLATYATNMTAIFQALKSAGLPAVICTVPPRDTGTSTAIRSLIVQYNHWIKMTAPAWGFEVADVYSVLVDTTTGLLAYDTGDGIHPSQAGHIRMTQEIGKAVNRLTRRTTPFGLVVAKDTNVNLVGDPLVVGGTTMPLSWSELGGSGTAPTYSLVSDTTSFLPAGRWAQMDFDAVSGGTRTMRSPSMSSGFSVGDTMLLCGHVQIEDVSGTWVTDLAAKTADVMFSVFDQGAALISASAVSNYCSGIPTTANAAIYNIGPVARTFTVPVATTSLIMTFRVTLPTGKRVKARLGCMGLFNLTTMQMTSYFGSGSMVNT